MANAAPAFSAPSPSGATTRRRASTRFGAVPPGDDGLASPLTIRLWLLCGVGVVVLATVFSAAVALWGNQEARDAQLQLQGRLRPAERSTSELARAYLDQETGLRGFVLTGQDSFLQPFDAGRDRAGQLHDQLAVLLAGDPESLRRLEAVRAAGTAWQTQAAAPEIAERRQGPLSPARSLALPTAGRELFDPLRQRLDELTQRVDQLVQQHLQVVARAAWRANTGIAVGNLVAILVAAATLVVLHRMTAQPLARLVEQLTAVAGGKTDQKITVTGPREVRTIAAAAETMRTSLQRNAQALAAAQHRIGAFAEQERMAAHLRDHTMQRLYGLSLSLVQLGGIHPGLSQRVAPLIAETDAITRELRGVIFPELSEPPSGEDRRH
nr:CHASE3 domain-containing protein [uncultured Friedmanniella sp.]